MANYPFHDWDSIRRGKALLSVMAAFLAMHFFGGLARSILAGEQQNWPVVGFLALFPIYYLWSLVMARVWAITLAQLAYFVFLILLAMRHYHIVWEDLQINLHDLSTDLVVDAVQLIYFAFVLFFSQSVRTYIWHKKRMAKEAKEAREAEGRMA